MGVLDDAANLVVEIVASGRFVEMSSAWTSCVLLGTAFAGAAAPQLFVHGQADEVVDYAAGKAVYDAVPWPKAMLSLPRGDHGRALLGDGPALRVVADTTIEFLRWSLYGDEAAKGRLPASAARGDVATLDDRL